MALSAAWTLVTITREREREGLNPLTNRALGVGKYGPIDPIVGKKLDNSLIGLQGGAGRGIAKMKTGLR